VFRVYNIVCHAPTKALKVALTSPRNQNPARLQVVQDAEILTISEDPESLTTTTTKRPKKQGNRKRNKQRKKQNKKKKKKGRRGEGGKGGGD